MSLNAYGSYAGASTVARADAESLVEGYGFNLERGSSLQGSRFDPSTGTIYIAPEHFQEGGVNSLVLSEELQHGIDEVAGVNAQAIQQMRYSGLTNPQFHAGVFDRILSNQGEFDFLNESDRAILQQLRNGLPK